MPQSQVDAVYSGSQLYRSVRASRKAPLWRVKPNSSISMDVSQDEAPFSQARSICLRGVGRDPSTPQMLGVPALFSFFSSLILPPVALQSLLLYAEIPVEEWHFLRASVTLVEERNSVSVVLAGLISTMSPNLAGTESRSHSRSFGGGLPVSTGISLVLMDSSMGRRFEAMLGTVCIRYVHLLYSNTFQNK